MATHQLDRLDSRDLSPLIGTAIHADKAALLSGRHADAIRDLLEQRGVLVFPQVNFTDEEQIAFTRTLGKFAKEIWGEEVYKISLDSTVQATAAYLRATIYWHIDGTMSPMPVRASILSSKVLPPSGGDTQFANTYAAYDALPDQDKASIEGLQVMHTLAAGNLYADPEPSNETWQEWRKIGARAQPLVWTHESGRKSLVLGATAHYIIGMDPLESQDLLIRLRDWATQPRFVYSHKWALGDAVMWDNTGSMHRVTPYPADSGRLLHRTKLEGEEPMA